MLTLFLLNFFGQLRKFASWKRATGRCKIPNLQNFENDVHIKIMCLTQSVVKVFRMPVSGQGRGGGVHMDPITLNILAGTNLAVKFGSLVK